MLPKPLVRTAEGAPVNSSPWLNRKLNNSQTLEVSSRFAQDPLHYLGRESDLSPAGPKPKSSDTFGPRPGSEGRVGARRPHQPL